MATTIAPAYVGRHRDQPRHGNSQSVEHEECGHLLERYLQWHDEQTKVALESCDSKNT